MTRKVIVAGSRGIEDYYVVENAILSNYPNDVSPRRWNCEIVHGGARGVDTLASEFADTYDLSEEVFEPQWDEFGPAAGPIRNEGMAKYGDMLIAVWDGESDGTRDMVEKALDAGIPTYVEIV